MIDDSERILALEIQVASLKEDIQKMSDKIDALLEFKHKGIGAVMLLSVILGSGLVASVTSFMSWLKG